MSPPVPDEVELLKISENEIVIHDTEDAVTEGMGNPRGIGSRGMVAGGRLHFVRGEAVQRYSLYFSRRPSYADPAAGHRIRTSPA